MLTVAESFKRFRARFNLSKTDVAKALNIKLPSYKYETEDKEGRIRCPSGETLIKLAKTYNVSTDYLLGLTDNPYPNNAPVTEVQTSAAVTKPKIDELQSIKDRLAKLEATIARTAS